MDDLATRLSSLTLPSRGSEEPLNEIEIKAVFEKWKLKKSHHSLRVLKESLVAKKLVDSDLGKEIYEAALEFYAENEEWAEFMATAQVCGESREAIFLCSILAPTEISFNNNLLVNELLFLLSGNYVEIDSYLIPKRIQKIVKSKMAMIKEEFVNKEIIR